MQSQRWEGEIVNPVHLPSDLNLIVMVAVHLNQHFDSQRMGLSGKPGDKVKRLRDHETTCAGFLDREASGIQPDCADTGSLEVIQDLLQIAFACGRLDIDIDLP